MVSRRAALGAASAGNLLERFVAVPDPRRLERGMITMMQERDRLDQPIEQHQGEEILLVAAAGPARPILVAAARALAQLLLVGAALTLVISPGRSIWWSWLWVAAMLGYAAEVARRRAAEVPHRLSLALASFTAAAVVTLACCSACTCSRSPAGPWCPSPG